MVVVSIGEVFYSKFVNTKVKGGTACLVSPQACGVWHGFISVGRKSFNDLLTARTPAFFNLYVPLQISR